MVRACFPNYLEIAFLPEPKLKPLRKTEDPDIGRIVHRCETGAVRMQQVVPGSNATFKGLRKTGHPGGPF
jgi:hypothetical protein